MKTLTIPADLSVEERQAKSAEAFEESRRAILASDEEYERAIAPFVKALEEAKAKAQAVRDAAFQEANETYEDSKRIIWGKAPKFGRVTASQAN